MPLASSVRSLLDLVLPPACAACGQPDESLCGACRAELESARWPTPCPVSPTPRPPGLPIVYAATPFAGTAARLVVAHKDGDRRDRAPDLSRLLGASVEAALTSHPPLVRALARGDGPVLVVPVPSSPRARRARGDSPLLALTRRAVRGFAPGEVALAPVLVVRRRVADQAGLGARDRAANLEHALAVRSAHAAVVARSRCLLVDDVLTTGATLTEAARALRSAGAVEVVAAVACATQRRNRGIPTASSRAPPEGLDGTG